MAVHVGDIGTRIKLNAGEDISAATCAKIIAQKPSGEVVVWTATIVANYAYYNTVDGDLDESGVWTLQLYANLPGKPWSGYGSTAKMTVNSILQEVSCG